jgi:glyoxylase-like metal-dependent hydrolase (beta-lactamase superfamily II)
MARVILPGVLQMLFPRAVVNAFLVNADVITLIDTGTPGAASKVLNAIRDAGHAPRDVKRILVTHRHSDHAGNAAELAEITGAEVHVAPAEAPFVTEKREQSRPLPATPLGKAMVPYVKRALPWEVAPVAAQSTLVEGAFVGPFRVIETPGHTAGHVSLLWPDRGILFTADAAAHLTAVGPHPAADDPGLARESFRRLAGFNFDSACFGHGRPIKSGAGAAFSASTG